MGNLGYKGKEKIIDKIQNLNKNTEILINRESYWQEIFDLKLYIKKNYKEIGRVRNLGIHKIN